VMMIAAPPSVWSFLDGCAAGEVAGLLSALAANVPVERMLRSRRGPKKPRKTKKVPGAGFITLPPRSSWTSPVEPLRREQRDQRKVKSRFS
jgi:hypothetical protein